MFTPPATDVPSPPRVAELTNVTNVKLGYIVVNVELGNPRLIVCADVAIEIPVDQVHAAGSGVGIIGVQAAGRTDQEGLGGR